jgi:hypothetical protein
MEYIASAFTPLGGIMNFIKLSIFELLRACSLCIAPNAAF